MASYPPSHLSCRDIVGTSMCKSCPRKGGLNFIIIFVAGRIMARGGPAYGFNLKSWDQFQYLQIEAFTICMLANLHIKHLVSTLEV